MTAREFIHWQAYYRRDPFGGERSDMQSATVAATIANVNRGKGQRAFKVDEFMPKFGPPQIQGDAEMAATMAAFAAAQNGTVKPNG